MSSNETTATSNGSGGKIETLEVEDDEQRMKRILDTLQKMGSSTSQRTASNASGMPSFDFGDRTTYEVAPNTELLSRLQAFLPQLEASNALLASQDPETFSIEVPLLPEGSAPYIEMNLGLGVFEDRSKGGGDVSGSESSSSESESEDSDESSSGEEEDDVGSST